MRNYGQRSKGYGTKTIRYVGAHGVAPTEARGLFAGALHRLMKQLGIPVALCAARRSKSTFPDQSASCPRDEVNRIFWAQAPNLLWVSDFTYVSTWQSFVYVASVIETFADRIVGWGALRSARADFVLDALEQALYDRRPAQKGGLIRHTDRGGAIFDQSTHLAVGRNRH